MYLANSTCTSAVWYCGGGYKVLCLAGWEGVEAWLDRREPVCGTPLAAKIIEHDSLRLPR